MQDNETLYTKIACALLALAVCLGAFGAHVLKGQLDAYSLNVFEKAVFYHFVHALGILAIPMMIKTSLVKKKTALRAALLLTFGITVFSGSLYVLAISGMKWLGAITPIGGLAFILGWLVLLISVEKSNCQ